MIYIIIVDSIVVHDPILSHEQACPVDWRPLPDPPEEAHLLVVGEVIPGDCALNEKHS